MPAMIAATLEMSKSLGRWFIGIERHGDVELFFDGKDAFNQTQAVDTKILQRAVGRHIRGFKHGLFGNDCDNAVADAHVGPLVDELGMI